jgi:kinetochore protein NNF1
MMRWTDSRRFNRPHLLSPDAVLAAHMAPHLAEQQAALQAQLKESQASNAALAAEIAAQREEAEALLAALEAAARDVEGASELMDGVVEDLGAETRTAEAEIAAAR